MVGKVDRIDNLELLSTGRSLFVSRASATYVNIVAQALKRKDSGLASHISVGDVGLYAEHPLIHGWYSSEERKPPIEAFREPACRTGPMPPSQCMSGIDEGRKEN